MLSNIEQAITSLIASNKAITISNIFSAYLTIAGIRELDTHSMVATFECAMDKHAPCPAVIQSPMIVQLRNQYWYSKLGGYGKDSAIMCRKCCHGGHHCVRVRKSDKDFTASYIVSQSPTQLQFWGREKVIHNCQSE